MQYGCPKCLVGVNLMKPSMVVLPISGIFGLEWFGTGDRIRTSARCLSIL